MKADTNFVKIFIDHLKGLFSPEDGSVLIPDCLGTIDSINKNCTKKTQYFINFFINEIGFEKKEILFIGEEEAR